MFVPACGGPERTDPGLAALNDDGPVPGESSLLISVRGRCERKEYEFS